MTLTEHIEKPDAQIDLAAAALCIAADEYPQLNAAHYMDVLGAHADAVRRRLDDAGIDLAERPGAILEALARHLFETEGFSGNSSDYYDPRNSFLNEVLERRAGIPITLSIVYLEVGQRLGLSIEPISFPTHFLVRVKVGQMDVVVDPFNKGAVLGNDTLIGHLSAMFGDRDQAQAYLPTALANAPRREVVARVLRNLKGIYVSTKDWVRALRVTDQLIGVSPQQVSEVRDRGHIYLALEHAQAARADYEQYLQLLPDADDAEQIRNAINELRGKASRLN